jgi:Mg-chelatase subunit ChlD
MELRVVRRERRGVIGLGRKRVVRGLQKDVRKDVRKAVVKVVDAGGGMGAIGRGVDARRCLRVVVRDAQRDGQRLARR